MKPKNVVCFGKHLIPERRLGKIENDVVRVIRQTYREYGLKRFDINLIRTAASQAIIKMQLLANELEKKTNEQH